ncbi:MAG: hypothetical protein PHV34_08460 [Verrucomicrobiae bacterium]|nr:hypothetical protein [Verrucomicrobiae bacterium]
MRIRCILLACLFFCATAAPAADAAASPAPLAVAGVVRELFDEIQVLMAKMSMVVAAFIGLFLSLGIAFGLTSREAALGPYILGVIVICFAHLIAATFHMVFE